MRRPPAQSVVVAVALYAASGTALGQPRPQDDGPVIVGERRGTYKWLELPRLSAAVEFLAQRREDRQRTPGQEQLLDREDLFRGTFELTGEAYIGHKNLLDVNFDVKLGIEDRKFSSESQGIRSHERSLLNAFNISGLFLQASDYPTTLYARREQTDLSREFSPTIKATSAEYGVISSIRAPAAPTTVQLFHREQEQADPAAISNYELTQDTFAVHSQPRLGPGQQLEADYTFDRIEETQGQNFHDRYDRQDASLVHSVDFGSEDQHNLRSSVRFYDQSGLYPQSQVRLDEQVLLRHTKRFETRYNLMVDKSKVIDKEQNQTLLSASLRHKLFDSLISTARIGGRSLEIPDEFRSREFFASGGLDYTKQVPFGRLDIGVGLGFNRQNNGARGTNISVVNESHVFNDPFPVVITRRNLVDGSIRVTDPLRVRVFIEGVDYTADYLTGRAELRRVIGGAIADGDAVLVSYQIGPEPSNQIYTTTSNLSVRYSLTDGWLDGLSIYAILRLLDQSVDAADPSLFLLDEGSDLRYGVEYRFWQARLLAEAEHYDHVLSPYDATRLEARFDQSLGRGSSLNLSATHETVKYHEPENQVSLYRVTANWAQRLGSELDFIARLQYRDETDELNGNVNGLEEGLEVRWHKRQTTVSVSARNAHLNSGPGDQLSQTFAITLRRDF